MPLHVEDSKNSAIAHFFKESVCSKETLFKVFIITGLGVTAISGLVLAGIYLPNQLGSFSNFFGFMASVKGGSIGVVIGLAISSVGVVCLAVKVCKKGKDEVEASSKEGSDSAKEPEPEEDKPISLAKRPESPIPLVEPSTKGENKPISPAIEISNSEKGKPLPTLKLGMLPSNAMGEKSLELVIERFKTYFGAKLDLQFSVLNLEPTLCTTTFDLIVYVASIGRFLESTRPGYSSLGPYLEDWVSKSKTGSVLHLIYGLEDVSGEMPKNYNNSYPSGIFLKRGAEKQQKVLALSEKDDAALEELEKLLMLLIPNDLKI